MIRAHWLGLTLAAGIAASVPAGAQQPSRYTAPRTEHGHPDFQGSWAMAFLTQLERPPGVDSLVVDAGHAKAVAAAIRANAPKVIDPDVQLDNLQELAKVKGQYRTSQIVDPPDGRMPFSKAGADLAAAVDRAFLEDYDHPEQRPLVERCLETIGFAPIRTVPVQVPLQIVQTRDYVLVMFEDSVGLRLIHLKDQPPPESVRTVEGYSTGRWEGATLVVETTHLRASYPARDVVGRPLVLSPKTKITERFTRVSETELFYHYTVEDPDLYVRPWSGEFSMTKHDGPIFEYACHEGNYSLPNILRGGQAAAAKKKP
ncbi:MAG TPA: hypothetical protein VH417_20200 [Vicinamibacterales bacterium]|jgi:hypothetical protein